MEQNKVKEREPGTSLRQLNRALSDLRRGVPVAICNADQAIIVMSCELLNTQTIAEIEHLTGRKAAIFITDVRAHALKIHAPHSVVALNWPIWLSLDEVTAVADPTRDLGAPFKRPFMSIDDLSADPCVNAAIEFAKQAELLPALVGGRTTLSALKGQDILCIDAASIAPYQYHLVNRLQSLVDAHVPLKGAPDARIFVFRPQDGGVEHLAIVIGDPSRTQPVLARMHSECLTGDILGSLKCDCGDQLRGALTAIEQAGGGVLLYLAQEGRGIGLANKLRAYKLQDQGFDTVDANLRLGFGVDERIFAPAATILKQLGFTKVRLMTNNPKKIDGLNEYGISVVERVAHQFPANIHNEQYLATKGRRTGHILKDI